MDINNKFDVLGSLLGVNHAKAAQSSQSVASGASKTAPGSTGFDGDLTKVSAAGALVSTAVSDVRTEKVATIQSAILSGTYNVRAADVAGKLISSMLGA